jgi:hypothetical protein
MFQLTRVIVRLRSELLKSHIKAANEWGNTWHTIHHAIHDSINQEMEKNYKGIDNKWIKLLDEQKGKPKHNINFYPTVIKYTAIVFSNEELQMLNKGLKYNLNQKGKQWISNLAFEAETVIIMLPQQEKNMCATKSQNT